MLGEKVPEHKFRAVCKVGSCFLPIPSAVELPRVTQMVLLPLHASFLRDPPPPRELSTSRERGGIPK